MATFKVTNKSNDGVGSLRQAIADANSNLGLDNIVFEVIDINLDLAILISDSVDITGNGAVITQTKNDRLFNISDGDQDTLIDINFDGLTLKGGSTEKFGGAINTVENLTINKVTLEDNTTLEKGAAIHARNATLTISDSLFQDNSVTAATTDANGGAIYLINGTLDITTSSFQNNQGAFGAIAINDSEATITNTSVTNNQGLGILVSESSTLDITQSDISDNSNGGILAESSAKFSLVDSSINNNEATSGAGIALSDSEGTIVNSIIIGNTAELEGGGIKADADSSLTITNSTLELNGAPIGSAISLNENSSALLMDTTIVKNTGSETQLEGEDFTIENTPVIVPGEASLDLSDVHRFYQVNQGFHLYTSDTKEIEVIREQSEAGVLPYSYEAEKFTVLASDKDSVTGAIVDGAKPVYRFFNTATGAHLYTMDENERGFISENLDNFNFEGVKYYAFESKPEDIETVPVFRLYNGNSNSHLFTIDQNEVDFIKDNLPQFSVEGESGIAYHVFELEL